MLLILIINIFLSTIHPATNGADTGRHAQFVRAEAAYINNDLFMAEKVFKQLLGQQPADDYSFNSMSRLIDIAEKNGDRRLFREILLSLKGVSKPEGEAYNTLLYAIGKYMLQSEEYRSAISFLGLVDKKSELYTRAIYLKASCLAGLKKYPQAILSLESLLTMKTETVTKDISDAAILAKARIFVLMKKYDMALSEYQKIDALSSYYLKSLEETARLFIAKKDYDQALSHLEALVFINKKLYLPEAAIGYNNGETFSDYDLMKLKTLQAYFYIDKERYDDSTQVFDEIMLSYNGIKKDFNEDLNRFKLSDDLTQVISHPYKDGSPRSLVTDPEFVLFGSDEKYSQAFREWLSEKDKRDFLKTLNLYYSILQRTKEIDAKKGTTILSDEQIRLAALRNTMKLDVKEYLSFLIKKINYRLDEIGLKAQLGKIDIIWRTKESQTRKIKEIQEKKQENLESIENKYRTTAE